MLTSGRRRRSDHWLPALLLLLFASELRLCRASARRVTVLGAPCGNDAVGMQPCPAGQYCQRQSAFAYLCKPVEPQCDTPTFGVAWIGKKLKTTIVNSPSMCCDFCAREPKCVAYTRTDETSTDPTIQLEIVMGMTQRCQLFSEVTGSTTAATAVSSTVNRNAVCPKPRNALCGPTSSCCPDGQTCVVADYGRFRCLEVSPKCGRPHFGYLSIYSGKAVATGLSAHECCELCASTPGCTGYDYTLLARQVLPAVHR
ncbi:hypothetical protein P43SY_010805 [Pythium insidiosum]|uniref:Apple domain-containing protein n=1 Tax=Pythium insidiosum TaxID=114742 RepID=A0AAD5L7Y9_PYTIN|nr:hypothetical protein P43SY_010805 [Pythium insidiosum]